MERTIKENQQIIEFIVKNGSNGRRTTSSEIRNHFNIIETTTGNFKTRMRIKEALLTAVQLKIAIGADSRGYFIIENDIQFDNYVKNLQSRMAGMQDRLKHVKCAYELKKRRGL